MVTKKVLENWLYWIVIDVVSIYLYYNRELHLTSLLFLAYTIIAIFGYFMWLNKNTSDA
jgi:nicotinamide mononucleotide transporter